MVNGIMGMIDNGDWQTMEMTVNCEWQTVENNIQ